MKSILCLFVCIIPVFVTAATFKVDCRDRSPELIPTKSGCLGPVAEIVERALTRTGHQINWQFHSWNSTIQMAETGQVDLVIRHSMNEERQAFLQEIVYGFEERLIYYYIAPHKELEIQSIHDLAGLVIGAKKGSFYSPEFESNNEVVKQTYAETSDVAHALSRGEIDVAITSEAHGLDRFQVILGVRAASYTEKFYNGRYISIPKASKHIRYFRAIEKEILSMVNDGEVTEIYQQYGLDAPYQFETTYE